MPEISDRLAGHLGYHVVSVLIAVGARKNENTEFHAFRVSVRVAVDASRGRICVDMRDLPAARCGPQNVPGGILLQYQTRLHWCPSQARSGTVLRPVQRGIGWSHR